MRVVCLIDDLGIGGGQRQIVAIACALARMSHQVTLVSYRPPRDYAAAAQQAGVSTIDIEHGTPLGRLLHIRRLLVSHHPDVVLAFLPMPSLYAELAGLMGRRWGLVVSERSSIPAPFPLSLRLRRQLHRLADAVVTNSHTNRKMVVSCVPALRSKTVTIYNLLDLERFAPAPDLRPLSREDQLRIVVAANYRKVKNPVGWAQAVAKALRTDKGVRLVVDWYGDDAWKNETGQSYKDEVASVVADLGIADQFRLHGVTDAIVDEYRCADAVAMPSFYEGLPNAVCEAMACARPVLASAVSDAPYLVREGHNGLLFDPRSVDSMADVLVRFAQMSLEARELMGQRGRRMAEEYFDESTIVARWLTVLEAAAQRQPPPLCHWIPEVE